MVAGLLGWQPETTDPVALLKLLRDRDTYPVPAGNQTFELGHSIFISSENGTNPLTPIRW